jgi:hypothetical protein
MSANWKLTPWNAPMGLPNCFLIRPFGYSQRKGGDPDSAAIEGLEEIHEPLPRLTQNILLRDDGILKNQLPGVACPPTHLVFFLTGPHPRCLGQLGIVSYPHRLAPGDIHGVLGDDETGDALVSRPRFGARGRRKDLSHPAMSNEDLGAVQDEVIAFLDRDSGCTTGITPRSRFGEAESPQHSTRSEQWHVTPLLFRGSELDNG